jgi:DnaJ-class molecular chaperone
MKIKITNGTPYTVQAELDKCVACNGSGYYDDWDTKHNRPYLCDACNGTGKESVNKRN